MKSPSQCRAGKLGLSLGFVVWRNRSGTARRLFRPNAQRESNENPDQEVLAGAFPMRETSGRSPLARAIQAAIIPSTITVARRGAALDDRLFALLGPFVVQLIALLEIFLDC
jgi:hypothetical protein